MTKCDVSDMECPESTSGTRYFPAFDEGLARRSFALHLMLIMRVIEQMSIDYTERHGKEDRFCKQDIEAVNLAISLMHAEGVVEVE